VNKRLRAKRRLRKVHNLELGSSSSNVSIPDDDFINAFDLEVLEHKEHFYNKTLGIYILNFKIIASPYVYFYSLLLSTA